MPSTVAEMSIFRVKVMVPKLETSRGTDSSLMTIVLTGILSSRTVVGFPLAHEQAITVAASTTTTLAGRLISLNPFLLA